VTRRCSTDRLPRVLAPYERDITRSAPGPRLMATTGKDPAAQWPPPGRLAGDDTLSRQRSSSTKSDLGRKPFYRSAVGRPAIYAITAPCEPRPCA